MSENSQVERSSQFWNWIFLSVNLVTAVTLAAVHMPARIKLLGLYSILFGLIVGEVLARLSISFKINADRKMKVVVFAFLLASQVGLAVESSRMYNQSMQQAANDPTQMLLQRVMTETESTGFKAYLQHRASPLWNLDQTWTIAFWFIEILVASAVGTFWFCRNRKTTLQNSLHKSVSEIDEPSPVE